MYKHKVVRRKIEYELFGKCSLLSVCVCLSFHLTLCIVLVIRYPQKKKKKNKYYQTFRLFYVFSPFVYDESVGFV